MKSNNLYSRHIGLSEEETNKLVKETGYNTLEELIDSTVPQNIRLKNELKLPEPFSEDKYLEYSKKLASYNKIYKTYIGMGYYDTHTPSVILRNIFENPSWYTSYTPYQAEISQGRLEALLNFQTMIISLTKMELANSSLLDEGTAASEAMSMMYNLRSRQAVKSGVKKLFVDKNIFPQTLDVILTHSEPLGVEVETGDYKNFTPSADYFGVILQYPAADGKVEGYSKFVEEVKKFDIKVAVAADIMALVLLTPPGEWGADIVFGSTQRFGTPMGFGGPHAAYFATLEKYKRNVPGRIIGVSIDARGKSALRMALQTREQHIKREKATSNICTAQALIATMAGMYAVYQGPEGLKQIATDIHKKTVLLNNLLKSTGYNQENEIFFDTLKLTGIENINEIYEIATCKNVNLNYIDNQTIGISINETTTTEDVYELFEIFAEAKKLKADEIKTLKNKFSFEEIGILSNLPLRTDEILTENVFRRYHTETEMMRYIKFLEKKDISLTDSMIPLGSCTMKLNAATEMLPLSWGEWAKLHPFVPENQAKGYLQMIEELGEYLKAITGFDAITFQPNSGAAGEFTGLMVIRRYFKDKGETHRNVMLIPSSAHGTNPASSVMAGMKVVVVECDKNGNIDVEDLKAKAEKHKDELAGFMVTYPSTHGVYEARIKEMVDIIHQYGGLVYMDGANMNAQMGLTSPAEIGADVCHLNLHKTFASPHGGGGPGAGPVLVRKELSKYLPSHTYFRSLNYKLGKGGNNEDEREKYNTAVSSAPYGSAYILPIAHAYIRMMGSEGLTMSSKIAILSANYIARKLNKYFPVLYKGENGNVAHELILDCRPIKHESGIAETDIAKRLMDYGFHAPTLSFPVHGTLMVEPTESESLYELNRFIETMISIYNEIEEVKNGEADKEDNVLKNSPHPYDELMSDEWNHQYTRTKAAFPVPWLKENKFHIPVARINDAYGDRNLTCTCDPIDAYREEIFQFNEIEI